MNYLILKYAYPLTGVVLVIFAWVVSRRAAQGGAAIVPLAVAAIVVWVIVTPTFVLLWPKITTNGFRKALVGAGGFGGRPIPANTLYAEPAAPSATAPRGSLLGTGTDHVLYVAGWLDLRDGPRVLHTPAMGERYYGLQFTDPSTSTNVAYVGSRATGTGAGTFLLCPHGWRGVAPAGTTRIDLPHRTALVIGRVYVASEADRPAAYALAQHLTITPPAAR